MEKVDNLDIPIMDSLKVMVQEGQMLILKNYMVLFLITLASFLPTARPVMANDGINVHKGDKWTLLQYFPEPSSVGMGYRVLPRDFEGGADGTPEYRWARPFSLAVIQYLAALVALELGVSPYPLAIYDICAENGDTPVEVNGKKLKGRHPGDSHDGGINLDIGYYLNDEKGVKYTPDFSACTMHFDDKGNDTNICTAKADRLDVPRQAYFYLNLFRINRDIFGGKLIKEIGIDREVEKKVLEQVRQWISTNHGGASENLLGEMKKIFTNDPFEGWAKFHHHHTHIRFYPVDEVAGSKSPVDVIMRMRDTLVKRASKDKAMIKGGVYSYNLERFVEFELDGMKSEEIKSCQFRLNGGSWEDGFLWKHACKGAADIASNEQKINVEVKVQGRHGGEMLFRREFLAPARPAFIYLKAETGMFDSGCIGNDRCFASHKLAIEPMITSVKFISVGDGKEIERGSKNVRKGSSLYYYINPPRNAAVAAKIKLSGRKEITLPVTALSLNDN